METCVWKPLKIQCFNRYLQLASASQRDLCVVKVPPCSPGCQQHSMLWSLWWASGPWATSSALFCSAGCIGPVVKCDHSAPLGPGLGAVGEQKTTQSLAVPPRSWSQGIGQSEKRRPMPCCMITGNAATLPCCITVVFTRFLLKLTLYNKQIWHR